MTVPFSDVESNICFLISEVLPRGLHFLVPPEDPLSEAIMGSILVSAKVLRHNSDTCYMFSNFQDPEDVPLNTKLFLDVTEESCKYYAHLEPYIAENTRVVKERAELQSKVSELRDYSLYGTEDMRFQLSNLRTLVYMYNYKIERLKKDIKEKDRQIQKLQKHYKNEQDWDLIEILKKVKKDARKKKKISLDVGAFLDPYMAENARIAEERNEAQSEIIKLREFIDEMNQKFAKIQRLEEEIEEKDEVINQLKEKNMHAGRVTETTEIKGPVGKKKKNRPEVDAFLKPFIAENQKVAKNINYLRSEVSRLEILARNKTIDYDSDVFYTRSWKNDCMFKVLFLEGDFKAKCDLIRHMMEKDNLQTRDLIDVKEILRNARPPLDETEKYAIDVDVVLEPYVIEKITFTEQKKRFQSEVLKLKEFIRKRNQDRRYKIFDSDDWKHECEEKIESLQKESKDRDEQIRHLKEKKKM